VKSACICCISQRISHKYNKAEKQVRKCIYQNYSQHLSQNSTTACRGRAAGNEESNLSHMQHESIYCLHTTVFFGVTSCTLIDPLPALHRNVLLASSLFQTKHWQQWHTHKFFSGGVVQQIQLMTEDRENGDLEVVAP
jgi:hypothetical protein